MKKGTFVIIEKDGRLVAAIKRADGGIVELEITVTSELQQLNGRPCDYLLKGDKIVMIGGKNIFKAVKQEALRPALPQKQPQTDWRQKMRENVQDETEIIENVAKPGWSRNDSFDLKKCRVPSDTGRIPIRGNQIDNFFLKLNQFARYEESQNNRGEWERKFLFFKGKSFQIQPNFGSLFSSPSQITNRQTESAKALFPTPGQLLNPKFRPEWRFVTGLGGHSVYETGITLHHVYGIPYIPASSIKGVLRSWVIYSKFGINEGRAISECEDFCKVFGCPAEVTVEREGRKTKYQSIFEEARQGTVTFFDAFPVETPTVEPDIMNPHYPKWYGGNGAPVDTDSPNPVFFLTVKDTPFQFLIGSKEWNLETRVFWDGQTLGWWLENALSEHGIGAKTAVGYGYMKPTP